MVTADHGVWLRAPAALPGVRGRRHERGLQDWARLARPVDDSPAPATRDAPPSAVTDPVEAAFSHLLAAAQAGEAAATRELYERLARPVAAYLRAHGVRDVDDTTSEVFLAVFSGLGRFRGGEPELRAWVLTIAHHRWVDEQRRAARRVETAPYSPEADDRSAGSAEQEALQRLATQQVCDRLDVLSADQRDVLLLRLVADLTVEHVAEIVGKRVGAVKALQRRGLAALRRSLDEGVPL